MGPTITYFAILYKLIFWHHARYLLVIGLIFWVFTFDQSVLAIEFTPKGYLAGGIAPIKPQT